VASEIEDLKFRYAHFHVFCMGVNERKMYVRASLKKRVRTENQIAFVNPLLVDYKILDEHFPGMLIHVDYCPPYHWALYKAHKFNVLRNVNKRGMKRIIRLTKLRNDLVVSFMRPHFIKLAEKDEIEEPEMPISYLEEEQPSKPLQPLQNKQYLTPREFAEEIYKLTGFRISEDTIRRKCKTGEIKGKQLPNSYWIIPKIEVHNFIEKLQLSVIAK